MSGRVILTTEPSLQPLQPIFYIEYFKMNSDKRQAGRSQHFLTPFREGRVSCGAELMLDAQQAAYGSRRI